MKNFIHKNEFENVISKVLPILFIDFSVLILWDMNKIINILEITLKNAICLVYFDCNFTEICA